MKAVTKVRFAITAVFMVTAMLFWLGCSEDSRVVAPEQASDQVSSVVGESVAPQVAAAPAAANWRSLTDTQRNSYILQWAQEWVKVPPIWGGQCKQWIQEKIVYLASGKVLYLPLNYGINDFWYMAKWENHQYVQVVWQSNSCPVQFPSFLKPGQMIQMRFYSGLFHTAIVESINSSSMVWIDSNWSKDEKVQRHSFSSADWQNKIIAATAYQAK